MTISSVFKFSFEVLISGIIFFVLHLVFLPDNPVTMTESLGFGFGLIVMRNLFDKLCNAPITE